VCWRLLLGVPCPQRYLHCVHFIISQKKSSKVHVHNVQICYIYILVPCWCAAPINWTAPINSSFTSS
uniref:Uncharacterized protein n=1 Tax=Macaca fascicularis TaxID=9541 RepID=A0A7N9CQ25_MACFA